MNGLASREWQIDHFFEPDEPDRPPIDERHMASNRGDPHCGVRVIHLHQTERLQRDFAGRGRGVTCEDMVQIVRLKATQHFLFYYRRHRRDAAVILELLVELAVADRKPLGEIVRTHEMAVCTPSKLGEQADSTSSDSGGGYQPSHASGPCSGCCSIAATYFAIASAGALSHYSLNSRCTPFA